MEYWLVFLFLAPLALIVYFRHYLFYLLQIPYIQNMVAKKISPYSVLGRLDHSRCSVTYSDGPNKYTIIFPFVRGPSKFYSVTHYGNDVTDVIRSYAGPSHNFHGIPTTPMLLGYTSLTFNYVGGKSHTYNYDDTILLSM